MIFLLCFVLFVAFVVKKRKPLAGLNGSTTTKGLQAKAYNPFIGHRCSSRTIEPNHTNIYAAFFTTTLVSVVKYMATAPITSPIRHRIKDH